MHHTPQVMHLLTAHNRQQKGLETRGGVSVLGDEYIKENSNGLSMRGGVDHLLRI